MMNPTKSSYLNVIFSALAIGMATLASASACDRAAIEGTWTRYIPQTGSPNSGTRVTWTISGDGLVSKAEYEDDLTASGKYGPYADEESRYTIAIDADACAFDGTATESVGHRYRVFREPTVDTTEPPNPELRSVAYRVELSPDGERATFTSADKTFTMSRAK